MLDRLRNFSFSLGERWTYGLLLGYLFTVYVLGYATVLSDQERVLLASPIFVFGNIVVGFGARKIATSLSRKKIDLSTLALLVADYFIGASLIFAFAICLDLLNALSMGLVLLFIISVGTFGFLLTFRANQTNTVTRFSLLNDIGGIVAISSGVLASLFYWSLLTFPEVFDTVLPMHNRVVIDTLNGHPLTSSPIPIWVTMSSYLDIALGAYVGNVQPATLFWGLPVVFFSLFSLGVYLFTLKISGDKVHALAASVVSPWLMTMMGVFQENYSVTPRDFLYMLFPIALYLVLETTKSIHKVQIRKLLFVTFIVPAIYAITAFLAYSLLSNSSVLWTWQVVPTAVVWPIIYCLLHFKVIRGSQIIVFLPLYVFLTYHTAEGSLYAFTVSAFFFYLRFSRSLLPYLASIMALLGIGITILVNYLGLLPQWFYNSFTSFPIFIFTLAHMQLASNIQSTIVPISDRVSWLIWGNTAIFLGLFLIAWMTEIGLRKRDLAIALTLVPVFCIYFIPWPEMTRIAATGVPFFFYILGKIISSGYGRAFKGAFLN